MNKYPHKQTADQLAAHGRYGDSVMVHMSPDEVSGIAALAPGGQLTTNPVTGQPEAFSLGTAAKIGVPIAAGIFAPYLLPFMAPAIAGGIGSGVATAAITGDLKRGLVSGVMGAGIGAAAGAAAGNAAGAAGEAAAAPMAEAAIPMSNMASAIGVPAPAAAIPGAGMTSMASQLTAAGNAMPSSGVGNVLSGLPTAATTAAPEATMGQGMMAPFQSGSGFGSELMKSRSLIPLSLGASQLGEMSAQDQRKKYSEEAEAEREAKRKQSYLELQGAYRAAQPNAPTGLSPYRNPGMPAPMYPGGFGIGGFIKKTLKPSVSKLNPMQAFKSEPFAMGLKSIYKNQIKGGDDEELIEDESVDLYGGIDPVTIQSGLRGLNSVSPPPYFMPGFNPEFNYFQDDPENIVSPPGTGPKEWSQMYAGMPSSRVNFPGGSYFENVMDREKPKGMAGGGIAELNQPQPQQPSPEDIQMLAQALMGDIEGADQIVEAFVAKYGPEVFQAVRQMILQSATPNAQTEGMVQGPGGGMDDQVQGMIGDQQPVAVSPGEYIVPADVVSGLGDGSSDAGATHLDGMSDNVRMARQGGRIEQPGPIDARNMLPA